MLITATDAMTETLGRKIRALGGEALDFSLIYTKPIHGVVLEKWFDEEKPFTWIVFTSRNGVEIFFEHLRTHQVDIRKLNEMKFAVIGKGTKAALEEKGIFCDCLPVLYSSADLGGH